MVKSDANFISNDFITSMMSTHGAVSAPAYCLLILTSTSTYY
jgi:hypothetical protein